MFPYIVCLPGICYTLDTIHSKKEGHLFINMVDRMNDTAKGAESMNLYLVRHGESMGNCTGKIQGWMDYPLSELGKKQIRLLANHFERSPLTHLYSSDLSRAFETAEAIGEANGLAAMKWDQIREVNLGPFQGLSRNEIYEKFPATKENSILTSGVEGTETVDELTTRCRNVIEFLHQSHENDHVALVSHCGFISIFIMYILLGEEWAAAHRPFQIGNTSISHVEWTKDKKPLIHFINQTAHLHVIDKDQDHLKMGLL